MMRTHIWKCRRCIGLIILGLTATSILVNLIAGMVNTVLPVDYWWVQIVVMMAGLVITRYLDRTIDRAHADGHPGLRDRPRDIVLSLGRHAYRGADQ